MRHLICLHIPIARLCVYNHIKQSSSKNIVVISDPNLFLIISSPYLSGRKASPQTPMMIHVIGQKKWNVKVVENTF